MSGPPIRQASCVAIDGRALMIEGPPGSGKTSLTLALIDRGATLIGDDGVTLTRGGEKICASPPPNITGTIELRNVGLFQLPVTTAPLALVLRIDPGAPRFVDEPDIELIEGVAVPLLRFALDPLAAAIRAEHALARYGIPS